MRKLCKKLAVYGICGLIAFGGLPMVSEAHSGRTDANGGHRDNQNKSGLGSYHYHCGGYPAHLHPNGVCPYKSGNSGSQNQQRETSGSTASNTTETAGQPVQNETNQVTAGWQQDGIGWKYGNGDGSFVKDSFLLADGNWYYFTQEGYMVTGWKLVVDDWYYFASDGRMVTGWQQIGDYWYYFDNSGHMVTGDVMIGEDYYYFDDDGKLTEDFEDWY
ncbi:YHYH domain-containing protein [Lacrimispora sp.]|uniref:YHYH domain-containing protein n=1 Tax=Lacrimispora sp. TaxID=2719234 RepID=UPI0034601F08